MRIAIFTNTYWPTINGVAFCIAQLKEGMEKLGHYVYVFAPAPPGFDVRCDQERVYRYPAFSAPTHSDYALALPWSRAIRQILRTTEFDVVHTHHPFWVGAWGQRYALQRKLPLVTTIHTQYEVYGRFLFLPSRLSDLFVRWRVRNYCHRCQIVTTPAESSRQRLLNWGVKTPIEVVHNPTDLAAFRSADGSAIRAQYGVEPQDFLIGYVGRVAPEKNLPELLEAAQIILTELPNAKMLIVGDGPSREALEQQAQCLSCRERIFFAGRIEHKNIPPYDAALDLFITPSMTEVQPLAFAEAMAAGTPIVAIDAPGGKDMIVDGVNGRLVPPSEQGKGLARAALEILRNPARLQAMRQQAREWAKHYERDKIVQQMLKIYEKAQALHPGKDSEARQNRKD